MSPILVYPIISLLISKAVMQDAAAAYIPYFAPFVRLFLSASTFSANLWARVAQVFGIWRAPPGVDYVHIEEAMTPPVEPRTGESKPTSQDSLRREGKRASRRGKQRQKSGKDSLSSNEGVSQDVDLSWGVENVVLATSRNVLPSNATKSTSRFGGPIPGSRFSVAYEKGSPQSLLNHVVTGKGPYDD